MLNKVVTIQTWLQEATGLLKTVSDAPRLEAEVLLANILRTPRSHLLAWPEQRLQATEQKSAEKYLQRRLANEPIAYILGHKEFWDIDLKVSHDTLVPRPETELLVEIALDNLPAQQTCVVADLGTGSGAIALALAKERPHWNIIATDQSSPALDVAKTNAKNLNSKNVQFYQGVWLSALPTLKFDAIISNPPYLAAADPNLENELRYEPRQALVAGANGFADLHIIIEQARSYLKPNGFLLLEHGQGQGVFLMQFMRELGYKNVQDYNDIAHIDRATIGFHS